MYEEFWNIKEMPFNNNPNPKYFFKSLDYEEALNRLLYTIQNNKGLCLVTGEIGCGKTTVSRYLVHKLPAQKIKIALIENPTLSPIEFIKEILYHFGVENPKGSKHQLLRQLNELLYSEMTANRKTIVIIDEAQVIPKETFEEIRLLLNFQMNDRFMLNLILLGQPELMDIVSALPQLDQRIALRYHLKPLTREDTKNYIHSRLKIAGIEKEIFSDYAVKEIFQLSNGVPRRINSICDLSMLIASGLKKTEIDDTLIKKAYVSQTGSVSG